MKKVLFLMPFLLLFVVKIYGQASREIYSETDTIPKVFYKDLVEKPNVRVVIQGKDYALETLSTLKSDAIASLNVKHRSVEIGLKPEYQPKVISLIAFKNKYTNVISDRVIFKIDDKIVQNNPEEVLIDESNIMLVTVSPIKSVGDIEDLYMITLITRTEKKVKEYNSPRIILR